MTHKQIFLNKLKAETEMYTMTLDITQAAIETKNAVSRAMAGVADLKNIATGKV